MSAKQRKEKLERLIEEFGLSKIRKSKGYLLSGGERRRCEIAELWHLTQNLFCLMNRLRH